MAKASLERAKMHSADTGRTLVTAIDIFIVDLAWTI
jgi:hypothetical protein